MYEARNALAAAEPARAPTPWARLRASSVQALAWLDLARQYGQRNLQWQAGYAARQAVRCDAALLPQLEALDIGSWQEAGDALLGRAVLPQGASLAGEGNALRANRSRLRQQMATSPLCKIESYLAHLESLYGRMWAAHCAGGSPRVIQMAIMASGKQLDET